MIEEVLYMWTVMILKISIVLLLWKHLTSRWLRQSLLILVILAVTVGLIHFFLTVFQCGVPTVGGSLWQHKATETCYSNKILLGVAYPQSTLNAFTNIVFCIFGWYLMRESGIQRGLKYSVHTILMIALM
jgi:hypothetical protein